MKLKTRFSLLDASGLTPWPPTYWQQKKSLAHAFKLMHSRFPVDAYVVDFVLSQVMERERADKTKAAIAKQISRQLDQRTKPKRRRR